MGKYYTVEVEADEMAKKLAKIICTRQSWLVREYNGDFTVTNWEESQKKLQTLIEKELLK